MATKHFRRLIGACLVFLGKFSRYREQGYPIRVAARKAAWRAGLLPWAHPTPPTASAQSAWRMTDYHKAH